MKNTIGFAMLLGKIKSQELSIFICQQFEIDISSIHLMTTIIKPSFALLRRGPMYVAVAN